MWFVLPIVLATGAGIAGFIFGEKRKGEEIEAKLREEYYKCISNTIKAGVNPQRAPRICSYTSYDITIGKVLVLTASLVSMGLALYAFSGSKKNINSKEEKYAATG